MTLMAASSIEELQAMTTFAADYNDGPIALRYPRGEGISEASLACMNNAPRSKPQVCSPLKHGKGRIVFQSSNFQHSNIPNRIAILSYGTRLEECLKAAKDLEANGKTVTIADARFAKPLDEDLIRDLVKNHNTLLTIEEGSRGGFGSLVLEFLAREDLLSEAKIKTLTLPDTFQDHDDPKKQYEDAGLVAENIFIKTLNF